MRNNNLEKHRQLRRVGWKSLHLIYALFLVTVPTKKSVNLVPIDQILFMIQSVHYYWSGSLSTMMVVASDKPFKISNNSLSSIVEH